MNKTRREKDKEKERGKKRFLERLVEEDEANKQIKEFDREELIEDSKYERPVGGVDGRRR